MAQKGSEGREVRVIDKMSQWANKWENSEWRPEEEEEEGWREGGCLGVSKCTGEDGGDSLGVGCNDSYSDDAPRRKRQGVELRLTTAGAERAGQEQQQQRKQNVLGDCDRCSKTQEQSKDKSEHRGKRNDSLPSPSLLLLRSAKLLPCHRYQLFTLPSILTSLGLSHHLPTSSPFRPHRCPVGSLWVCLFDRQSN